jgi:sugar phosphate isomerase/epimerase
MNFPGRSVLKEIHRIADERFDFVDLTLEPPAAWLPDGKEVGKLLSDLGLFAVGHTAWHLPIAAPFKEIRKLARDLYRKGLDCFAEAGVSLVNVHPQQRVPLHSQDQIRVMNAEAVAGLVEDGNARGIRIMVENMDASFSDVPGLSAILDAVPEAAFHLDIGHANLRLGRGEPNRTKSLLEAFGERLAHVHVSDNNGGGEDLHLPLGAGMIDWKTQIRALQATGYDGTVTLEVFSREREHLRSSRKLWLEWWSEAR